MEQKNRAGKPGGCFLAVLPTDLGKSIDYIREAADQFLARCRDIPILGPTDFTKIAEWEKQEIPLRHWLDSINEVCGELRDESDKIRSISDLQGTVKKNFVVWLQSTGGWDPGWKVEAFSGVFIRNRQGKPAKVLDGFGQDLKDAIDIFFSVKTPKKADRTAGEFVVAAEGARMTGDGSSEPG